MSEGYRFMIIEDRDDDAREVLMQLSDAGFSSDNQIARAATYDAAKSSLEEHAATLDVAFLDLNIPRNETDGRPEKGHGKSILDLIHKDMNRRPGVNIKVIVISGEDLHDGAQNSMMEELYKGTLFGICKKSNLSMMLKASLKRLKKDPIRSCIQRNNINILDHYDALNDTSLPIIDRLTGARSIAIRLLQNEIDHYKNALNSCMDCADDLNNLIKRYVEIRFSGNAKVKAASIKSPLSWNNFLWRGTMIQHLYTINSYRNNFIHLDEQPFRTKEGQPCDWVVPTELIRTFESGSSVAQIVQTIVRDLLEWYLPWHEQVYVPWYNKVHGDPA